jgi:outer membrane immunogenic protein
MTRLALQAGVALLLLSGSASAADMAVKAKPVTVVDVWNWTGFYIGGNVGYGWSDGDRTVTARPNDQQSAFLLNTSVSNFSPARPPVSFGTSGVIGGLQFGYNWQLNNWLVGVEADINAADINGRGAADLVSADPGIPFRLTADEHVKWFGTARARAGFLVTPNLLFYGTAGIAYGQVDHSAALLFTRQVALPFTIIVIGTGSVTCAPLNAPCYNGSTTENSVGWTAGGGAEYKFAKNWSIKGEYLYVDLGYSNYLQRAINFTGSQSTIQMSSHTTFHTARVGINYQFGGPVVAKY